MTHRFMPALVFIFLLMEASGHAQAWVPPAGQGSISIAGQRILNTGHILDHGERIDGGKSLDAGVYAEAEYAITDRLSISAGIPFVMAKYIGPGPGPFPIQPVDSCYCWQTGWQDFGFTARYNVVNLHGKTSVTPSVTLGLPSHDYIYQGEAVLGRGLRELKLGIDAGERLDFLSPRLSVQGSYSYAVVEHAVQEVPDNRSNAGLEVGVAVTRRVSARWISLWQRTHGGLRLVDITTQELIAQHDRMLRDNYWHTGAGASVSFRQLDVFASYLNYARGTDTHRGHVLTAGISWPFEFSRLSP